MQLFSPTCNIVKGICAFAVNLECRYETLHAVCTFKRSYPDFVNTIDAVFLPRICELRISILSLTQANSRNVNLKTTKQTFGHMYERFKNNVL